MERGGQVGPLLQNWSCMEVASILFSCEGKRQLLLYYTVMLWAGTAIDLTSSMKLLLV